MSANGDDMADTTADADADSGGPDRTDPSLPGNNEPGEFDPIERGIDAARVQRQRRQLRRRAADEAGSDYSPEDIAVREGEGDRLQAQITQRARERERQEARQAALTDAAQDFDRYGVEDLEIVEQDGERVIQPTESAVERERQETRQELRQEAVQEIEGVDDPSAINVIEDGDTLRTELTEQARQRVAIERNDAIELTETLPEDDGAGYLEYEEAQELMEGYPVPPQRDVVTSIRDVDLAELPESTAEDILRALESGDQADIGLSPTGRTVDAEGGPLAANEQSQRVIVRPDQNPLTTADTTEARIAAQLGVESVELTSTGQPSDRNVLDDFRSDTSPGQLDPVDGTDTELPQDEVQDAGRVVGGLDELQFDDDGTVVIDESNTSADGTVRDPANLDDAGRVEGGLDELRFGAEGTAIIEETPSQQGIETESDAAARVEEAFTERTGLDDDEVRVVQDYQGGYVASPSEQFEQGIETRAAEQLGVDPETVEADVDRDFSFGTDLSREGQLQRAERQLEAQLGEELEQSDVGLQTIPEEQRQRLFDLARLPDDLSAAQRERLAPDGAITVPQLSDEFQRERTRETAAEQFSDELDQDIAPSEVRLQETIGGIQPTPPQSALEERAVERAAEQIHGSDPDAESVLERRAFPGLDEGEHFEVEVSDDGSSVVKLTPDGREIVMRTLARSENPDADSELVREEFEGELQFDDQGNITNAEPAEQFGDVPVVDDALRDAGDWLSNNVIQPSASGLAGFVGGIGQAAVTLSPGEDPALRRSIRQSEEILEAGLSAGGETLNVPNTTAGLIEIGEFGGKALETTVVGDAVEGTPLVEGPADQGEDFDEFAARTESAAAAAASGAAEQAAENPAKTAAAVTGSLAVTAGTIGAASRLSGTAGRASALAIQPGEEIATAGASRVLGTTSRGQRILNAFPNNRIDNEEIVLRGLQRGARRARASLEGGGARLRQTLRERTPNVDVNVEQNPDAPAVDVRRGGSGSNAQEGLDDLIEESQDADVSATDTVMDASRGIDDRLLSRQLQLQATTDRATEGVGDLISESQSADVSATEEILGLSRSIDDRVLGAQRRLEGAMLRARSRARRGEEGVDELIAESQSADVSITGPIMRASYGIDNRVLSRQLQLQAAGDRATQGFGDLITESQAADASLRDLALDASRGIDERLLGAQARASDEISILGEGVDDLVTESQAADASLEELVMDASHGIDEGVLRAQSRAGNEVQNLEEGLDDLVDESQSADVSAGELLQRARDTTVTVEIGKPSQRELPADVFELDEGATPSFEGEVSGEGDIPGPSGIEAETTTGESQQLQIAAEQERETRSSAVESERQGSPAPRFDGRLEADFPEPGETLADEVNVGEVSLEDDLGVSGTDDFSFTDVAQPEDIDSGLDTGVDESLGYDDDVDLRQELDPESEVETETERETETRIDFELGQEPALDNELETVLEFEAETETETEAELFGEEDEENELGGFVEFGEEDEEFGTGIATAEELADGWTSDGDWVDNL